MSLDPLLTIASFGIGIVVGLTGMGGGALMTPVLVLFFQVPPLTAVSSDLVASAVMKPVGSFVHLRRGTVHLGLVKWLCIGSIPGAFSGVLIARALGKGQEVQDVIRIALGVALLLAAIGLTVRAYLRLLEHARRRDGRAPPLPQGRPTVDLRVVPTIALGLVGGVVVGMTSVGSGSLIIIALMALYPTLKASELVGTDLVQAVPLVASAAIGHLLFGDFHLDLTTSLLLGCIPGVWVGAHLSSRAPGGLVRRALAFVLLASALKLFNISNVHTGIILVLVLLIAPVLWMLVRRRHGFPALAPKPKKSRDPA
ncbi:MAG TPA: sulfite exporter TauE/SafE family protein [Gemmatimonadales bacterium]|nr:sulfite exporter TauE/SafE family protein [Gemmatimonadales bacterium]